VKINAAELFWHYRWSRLRSLRGRSYQRLQLELIADPITVVRAEEGFKRGFTKVPRRRRSGMGAELRVEKDATTTRLHDTCNMLS